MSQSWLHLACLLATLALATPAPAPQSHQLARRSTFYDLECKGYFDDAMFASLDRICDECYVQIGEPEIYVMCRKECFTSFEFKGCVDMLQKTEQLDVFKEYIKILHGADPRVY